MMIWITPSSHFQILPSVLELLTSNFHFKMLPTKHQEYELLIYKCEYLSCNLYYKRFLLISKRASNLSDVSVLHLTSSILRDRGLDRHGEGGLRRLDQIFKELQPRKMFRVKINGSRFDWTNESYQHNDTECPARTLRTFMKESQAAQHGKQSSHPPCDHYGTGDSCLASFVIAASSVVQQKHSLSQLTPFRREG